jgi:outer membrane protein OmpA-like peptidoglycan-associated protein
MQNLITSTLLCLLASSASAQCTGYPCDTLWYDEDGKLKDEFVLTGIAFDLGRSNLVRFPQDGSTYGTQTFYMYNALDSLANTLIKDNGYFEIQCHLDCRVNDNASIKLSQQRARAVCEYLVIKGVHSGHLVPKGFEDKKPRMIDDAGNALSLTCDYVMQYEEKDKNKYEFFHQLNRRIVVKRLN